MKKKNNKKNQNGNNNNKLFGAKNKRNFHMATPFFFVFITLIKLWKKNKTIIKSYTKWREMFIKINRVGKSNGKHVETSTHPPTTRYYYYNYNYTTLMLLIFLFKGGFCTRREFAERNSSERGEGPHPTTWFLLWVCVCVCNTLTFPFI